MVSTGDVAPDFTAPLANGGIDSFTLSENLDDSPIVVAFFPGAFTSVCTHEMKTFEEREVVYQWVSDDPGVEPDYDDVLTAIENVA